MDAFADRASKTDKRIALDRLARARRRGRLDGREYRLRCHLAEQAESVAELRELLVDVTGDTLGKDHWRFGHWQGPVKDGRELEIQRLVGACFLAAALVVAFACVYAAIYAYGHWR